MEEFKNDFRLHHHGPAQRPSTAVASPSGSGARRERVGRLPADDQLGLMDPSRIRDFLLHGLLHRRLLPPASCCQRARPTGRCRRGSARPSAIGPKTRTSRWCATAGDNWLAGFRCTTPRRADGDDRQISPQSLPRVPPISSTCVPRAFIAANCPTPILVLGRTTPHRIRCRHRSTLRHWRPMRRSRSSRGAIRRS